jgi:hypothetical protein
MNDLDKLRVMLPHWIEHNQSHASEFSQWQEKLADDTPEVAALLATAVRSLKEAQTALEETLEKAGGALESAHGHGKSHHHH